MKAKEIFYYVAVYLRLSRDDMTTEGSIATGGGKTESNSISSQRDMIRSFIQKQDDMTIYYIYVDESESGGLNHISSK